MAEGETTVNHCKATTCLPYPAIFPSIDTRLRLFYCGAMSKNETTIDDLARMAQAVAKLVDDLAIITKHGFDGVDKQFGEVRQEMESRFDKVERRLSNLEQGQEDIPCQRRSENVPPDVRSTPASPPRTPACCGAGSCCL